MPLPTELIFETKTKSESTSGATQFMPDPKLMDHGQSHPEDIDICTVLEAEIVCIENYKMCEV